ncbi:conserved hypothetical protein [Lodderomyces elongisporus NRRL YB-4239]|uniref:Non-classical export protein 1 n=1 Tax=Lodderomyces elongisporus (strain ATCC 11503 / CBS 2605 / JCM 1781 / NBRC 1676 / NRRL YB-4239) TaxID=379508 RepID=A5E2C8_LODEL|nr:conserved hypothetical protein [Lodderomyces elongisporus NRRL YB-4239]
MQYPYLISRWADPIFGIGMGVASYYLYERRVGRPEGHSLNELVLKRFENWKSK